MKRIKVNPRVVDGKPLRVQDELGRVIPLRDGGTELRKTTHISRCLKSRDLVLVDSNAKPAPRSGTKKED